MLVLACVAAAASAAKPPATYYPGAEWRQGTPKSQKLDSAKLAALVEKLRSGEIADIDSLLIVRNGYLVVEEYFNGSSAEHVHTLQSDSKSVTSLLVGIALKQGYLRSLDQRVLDFFPDYAPFRNLDQRKEAMTRRDLITMRGGFDWSEANYSTSPLAQLNTCRCDWLRFVLDWPMWEAPGERWEYNSGGVILLGGALVRATGQPIHQFAREQLFTPLGIQGAFWYVGLPDNLAHTGGGLNMRASDMARIGYLLLKKGKWAGQQIVSEAWLKESTQHWTQPSWTLGGYPADYGYLWWLLPVNKPGKPSQPDIYTAAGSRDQWIFVIPRYEMVVVVTGNTSSTFAEPVDFLYRDILPAVLK